MTDTTYVFAFYGNVSHTTEPPILIAATPTRRGWRTRSTSPSHFNHEYVSYEGIEDVVEWLEGETSRAYITTDRAEALEHLSVPYESGCATGYFQCDPRLTAEERAERVLRHLERGM
jgi:hypothetical protein